MKFLSFANKFLAFVLGVSLSTLIISLPVSASIADWGMVQQFTKKLEMANEGKIE